MMISSGSLIPTALEVIGFGAKGPMAGSLAAAVQRQIGAISAGSVFAHLQSAAMGGAVMGVIQRIATRAFVGLGIAGAATFIGASSHLLGQETHFEQVAWKVWERKSQTDSTPELVNQMMHVWGTPTAERCVAYGYREYRAPIRFVPKGLDPMNACLQSSAAIEGVGFKKPFKCTDERSKDGVVGTWYVQSNETVCLPHWSEFEDEGCMQFGTRRVFSRLMGARQGDDWNGLCETTPARIHDTYFVKPTYCQDKGVLGIYGTFDMPDEECECYCTGV
ncbi:hypothetical protein BDV93DRAFT_520245 [Ceratobasidium sp. AG-I]|nr:hypothetical protein BDV93DRAFT_520245 [Ceratobasidium sp. AG-I]